MSENEFEVEFGNYSRQRCKENNCALKNISREKWYIIDGDKIKDDGDKSVDCIIINLNQEENGHRIVLCELTTGNKNINDAIDKFKASGELIINYLKEKMNKSVYKLDCLVLGDITEHGKTIDKKVLLRNQFRINGLNNKIIINRQNCGYSITELES